MTQRYSEDLVKASAELDRLTAEREHLEARIARQKKIVAALRELVEEESGTIPQSYEQLAIGITDACRTVLRAAGRSLLPIEVRDGVQRLGLPPQANILASVYTVLRRLKLSGEVIEEFDTYRNPGGSAVAAYRWAGPMQKLGYTVLGNSRKK